MYQPKNKARHNNFLGPFHEKLVCLVWFTFVSSSMLSDLPPFLCASVIKIFSSLTLSANKQAAKCKKKILSNRTVEDKKQSQNKRREDESITYKNFINGGEETIQLRTSSWDWKELLLFSPARRKKSFKSKKKKRGENAQTALNQKII